MQPLRFVLPWVTVCSAVGNAPVCHLLNCTGNNKHKVEVFHSLFHLNLSPRKGIIDFVFHEKLLPNLLWGLWLSRHWSKSLGMCCRERGASQLPSPWGSTNSLSTSPKSAVALGKRGRKASSLLPCTLGGAQHTTTACDKSWWVLTVHSDFPPLHWRRDCSPAGRNAWTEMVLPGSGSGVLSGDLYYCPPAMAHVCLAKGNLNPSELPAGITLPPADAGKGSVVGQAEPAGFILWMVLLCCTNSTEGPHSSDWTSGAVCSGESWGCAQSFSIHQSLTNPICCDPPVLQHSWDLLNLANDYWWENSYFLSNSSWSGPGGFF